MVEYLLLRTLYTYVYVTHTYHKDIYICIGIFAYNQTCIHTCTHRHTHGTHAYAYIHVLRHIYKCTHTYTHTQAYIHTFSHMHINSGIHTHVYVCIYIHTCAHVLLAPTYPVMSSQRDTYTYM